MIAVIEPSEIEPDERIVFLHFHARLAHRLEIARVHLARADPVNEHVDFDPGSRAFGQCFSKFLTDVARPVNVSLQIDGVPGAADRFEHRGKDLIAVNQSADAIAGEDGGTNQVAHRPQKLRVVHRVFMVELVANSPAMETGAARNTRQQEQKDSKLQRKRSGGTWGSFAFH